MSKNLIAWIKHLEHIASISDTKRRNARLRAFAENMNFFEALKEIAINTINKNIPLNIDQKKKLRRYSNIFKELCKKRYKNKKIRSRLILQSGGFLPILIPLVTSVLGELIRNG